MAIGIEENFKQRNCKLIGLSIAGSVPDEDAKKLLPGGWKAPQHFSRIGKKR